MEVKEEARGCLIGQEASSMEKTGSGYLDCSVCLDSAAEPVVTLCGHLYCWPCIYKWMQHAGENGVSSSCPVCKAPISENALVPLYGRGRSYDSDKGSTVKIPDRPAHPPTTTMVASVVDSDPTLQQQQQPYQYMPSSPSTASVLHSTAGGVLCGMADAVLPWVSGNLQGRMCYSSPYVIAVSGSNPRMRMQELRIESSLNQIWGFFFCCVILCFFFF